MVVNQVPITDQILKLTILMMQKKKYLNKSCEGVPFESGLAVFLQGYAVFLSTIIFYVL